MTLLFVFFPFVAFQNAVSRPCPAHIHHVPRTDNNNDATTSQSVRICMPPPHTNESPIVAPSIALVLTQ